MNKSELVEKIAQRAGLPLSGSRKALDAVLECVSDALAAGGKVQLVGFGTPQTGAVINIPATKTPSFSAGAELKKVVNNK